MQHEHPPPWEDLSRDPALPSLAVKAWRLADDIDNSWGAVSMTRGALALQDGQFDGRSHSAMARMSVKGPHSPQR